MDTLGKRIRALRGKETQEAYAARVGISKGSIGGYELDKNSPSADVILKICAVDDISFEWLLTGKVSKEPGARIPSGQGGRAAELEAKAAALEARVAALEAENAALTAENARLKDEALNAYKEALRVTRASLDEHLGKGGSGIIDAPASVPPAPLHGRTNK